MRDGVPLPAALSGTSIERLIRIDEALIYLVNGALEWLCDKEKLEQTGTLTVDDAKTALSDMFQIYFNEEPAVIPIGATMTWHMALPPAKWLVCNGQSVAKATYPELFALWGTKYGSTSTHFTLLNMTDLSPMGAGGLFPVVDGAGGAFNHTLLDTQMPAHTHGVRIVTGGAAGANNALVVTQANVTTTPTINTSNSTGGGLPHPILHPVKAVKWIVYAGH